MRAAQTLQLGRGPGTSGPSVSHSMLITLHASQLFLPPSRLPPALLWKPTPTTEPSASTSVAARMLSQVAPTVRESRERPPLSARPPTPTVEQMPSGAARLRAGKEEGWVGA